MNVDDLIETNLRNAKAVGLGQYTGLLCPKCFEYSSEAFFSMNEPKDQYGLWFQCSACGNIEHFSCGGKPAGFSHDRISRKFQELDEQAWRAES